MPPSARSVLNNWQLSEAEPLSSPSLSPPRAGVLRSAAVMQHSNLHRLLQAAESRSTVSPRKLINAYSVSKIASAWSMADCQRLASVGASTNACIVGDRPFHCDQCPFRTSTGQNLKVHFRRKHSEEKAFQCDKCPYKGT